MSHVSISKIEPLENEKFLRNETTSNFQSGFDIFDDLLKKNNNKIDSNFQNDMFCNYIGFLSIYFMFMLKKLHFVNLLRKTKRSDIFFIEVLPRYFFKQVTYF